ncbi:MAG: hypothetical protein V4702_03875 [Patescibacteria group bacterium]
MSEIESLDPEAALPNADPARRDFLLGAARAGFAVLVAGQAGWAGSRLARWTFDAYATREGQSKIREIFEPGIQSQWHKLAIFDGLMQLDPSTLVADSIFADEGNSVALPTDKFSAVVRPISVRETLLRNIADYSQATQDNVNRVLPNMPRQLFAFWLPGQADLTYYDLDAHSNRGSVIPLSETGRGTVYEHVGVRDVNIGGRELRDNQVFPYLSHLKLEFKPPQFLQAHMDDLPEDDPMRRDMLDRARDDPYNYMPVQAHRLIGQVASVDNAFAFNAMVTDFYAGKEALAIPAP